MESIKEDFIRYQKVNIEITNVCNLQCSFCPEVERDKNFMSVERFKFVVGEVSKVTDLITQIGRAHV